MTPEDHRCKDPFDDGGFPFNKNIVLKYECHPTKNENNCEGYEMSCLKSPLPNPEKHNLKNRGDNSNRSGNENVIKFVGRKKKESGEKSQTEFS